MVRMALRLCWRYWFIPLLFASALPLLVGCSNSLDAGGSEQGDNNSFQPRYLAPGYLPEGYVLTDQDFEKDRSGVTTSQTMSYQSNPKSTAALGIQQEYIPGGDVSVEMIERSTPITIAGHEGYYVVNNAGNKHGFIWSEGDIVLGVTWTDIPLDDVRRVAEMMR